MVMNISDATRRVRLAVLVLFLNLPVLKASCFNNSLIGKAECIRVGRYSGWQWSTCVSDLYIRQKSKGRHGCEGEKTRCVYQCMLEIHDLNSGEVRSPCTCSSTDQPTAENRLTKLPSWCFSPSGTECGWYNTCLCERYNCDKGFSTEVVAFAEQFCRLYLNAYSQFTPVGDLWLNGVRKCLQVSLVPLLRRWRKPNYENLTKNAINSFSNCFEISPFPGIPSICNVPLADLWSVFWHLRQTLPTNSRRVLQMILRIIENCTRFREERLNFGKVRKIVFQLPRIASDCDFQKIEENDQLAKNIGDEIAKELFLHKKGITWFSYPLVKNPKQPIEIVFFIADRNAYRMSQKLRSKPAIDLNNTVLNLVKAVRRKTLRFKTFDMNQQCCLTGIVICHDFECRQNSWKVTADETLASGCVSCRMLQAIAMVFGRHALAFFLVYMLI